MKPLIIFTAILEAAAGIILLTIPSLATSLLLGVPLETPGSRAVARIGGAALLAFGAACWAARSEPGSRTARGLIPAMLIYDCGLAAIVIFAYTSAGGGMRGIALWPAAALHTAHAAWCVMCMLTPLSNPALPKQQP